MKRNTRIIIISVLIFVISFTIIPAVLAKPRKTYLKEFIVNNQLDRNKGFAANINAEEKISYEATAYALEIIEYLDVFTEPDFWPWETKTNVNISETRDKLTKELNKLLDETIDLYNLYYLLRALNVLNYSDYISSSIEDKIEEYIEGLKHGSGGFMASSTSNSATVASTYLALSIYDFIDEKINKDSHIDWVLSCRNSDGGYGGNTSLSSTISNTFYAVLTLDEFGDIDELVAKDKTVDYLNSFFVDDEADEDNYGGYLPDKDAKYTLLSSTYYCVKAISLLDMDELNNESTINWALNHQNFRDGGFIEKTDEYEQGWSSIISSYYAFETLKVFDPDFTHLEEDVFMVEFSWIIFIILMTILLVALIVIVYIRRKRRF